MLVDKYRPQKLDEVIGRKEICDQVRKYIASPEGVPHLMFFGPPGTGKTTIAGVIANELFGTRRSELYSEFNASNERGIEMVRTTIVDTAKRPAFDAPYRIILMDEADNITADAQAAFRRILEQYSKQTRFIFTCNYPHKLIDAIRSRFVKFELGPIDMLEIAKHLKRISKKEGMELRPDPDYVLMAKKSRGDLRAAINMLEGVVIGGANLDAIKLDQIQKMNQEDRLKTLVFNGMDYDAIYDALWEKVKSEKRWDLISWFADCRMKMNYGNLKEVFLCDLVMKI